ncbi:hypothetical protein R4Y45_06435 [Holzapfeliella sp. He02]|uniref:EthD domain-containing protein n=1 Tax=Holzapfeliella saturejae TaxID=3082953 RepID=A0ABU8SHJ3_9LACO
MRQLRIYTLADAKSAKTYFETHWQRHISSLAKYHIQVANVHLEVQPNKDQQTRVFATVFADDRYDLNQLNDDYMKSQEFHDDMVGFDMSKIVNVETIDLKPFNEVGLI